MGFNSGFKGLKRFRFLSRAGQIFVFKWGESIPPLNIQTRRANSIRWVGITPIQRSGERVLGLGGPHAIRLGWNTGIMSEISITPTLQERQIGCQIGRCYLWQSRWTKTQDTRIWHSEDRTSWYILITNANEMHSISHLFDKVLYMFRTGPLSIIRRISTLYSRNTYLSY